MTMHRRPPQIVRQGFYTLGQLAEHWGKPPSFVRNLVDQGVLTPDERGHVGNEKLAAFYRDHASLLDVDD